MKLGRDWDAQIEAANGDDVVASIGILRCSMDTHAQWAEYIESLSGEEREFYESTRGSIEWHRRCVREYTKIIEVIERLRNSVRKE